MATTSTPGVLDTVWSATKVLFTGNSSNTERKTEKAEATNTDSAPKKTTEAERKVLQSSESNVLNGYRSSTYNFTLSGLRASDAHDETLFKKSASELIILKSGGKGPALITGLTASASDIAAAQPSGTDDAVDRLVKKTNANKLDTINTNLGIIEGFNTNSPGRFDMFINNVEIETLMAFSEQGGTTLPLSVKFDVYEPYSINGFFEALQVVALAAGYPTYLKATYLLKVEFVGYADSKDLSESEVIPKTTRYFPIQFTSVTVDVNERGTKYGCAAILFKDSAFGQPNLIKRPITMAGNSVSTVLADLASKLNKQIADDDTKSKDSASANDHDTYEILFPVVNSDRTLDYNKTNDIGLSLLSEYNLRENKLFKFMPIGDSNKRGDGYKVDGKTRPSTIENSTDPTAAKHDPISTGGQQIQVAENQQLHEIIAAVIRDSIYIRKKLSSDNRGLDDQQFFDYFIIRTEVVNKSAINTHAKRPYQNYKFIVIPHKIHFTRIPRFQSEKFDPQTISGLSVREYNYLYMGNNVDVIDFTLNFNNLYYEAAPPALGNNDKTNAVNGAGPSSSVTVKSTAPENKNTQASPLESPTYTAPIDVQPNNVSGNQMQYDPYYAMARNMHESVINSKTNLLTGDITILGDPVYLVTGGLGSDSSKNQEEVDYLSREVLVTINFRNPVDITTFEEGGTYKFDSKKLPFSGLYRVIKVTSIFNDGVFKQRLEIMRVPGQILSNEVVPTNPTNLDTVAPKPNDTVVVDTTKSSNVGMRPATQDIMNLIGREIPTTGLPGALSKLTAGVGMLSNLDQTLKNKVGSLVSNGINEVNSKLNVFGNTNLTSISSNLRMLQSGLVPALNSGLQSAASAIAAAATISPINIVSRASTAISDVSNKISSIAVQGSGIGEGASVYINRVSSEVSGAASALTSSINNAVGTVAAMGNDASKLISGIGGKVDSLIAGTTTDPQALASKFGLDVSQLSGLSSNLSSKVLGELESLAKQIPDSVNIAVATAKGLALNTIPSIKLPNIPATPPDSTAPSPAPDTVFLEDLAKKQGLQAVANAYGVLDVKKLSSEFVSSSVLNELSANVSKNILNPLSGLASQISALDTAQLRGRLDTAVQQMSAVTGAIQSVESKLGSINSAVSEVASNASNMAKTVTAKFGSISAATSPLDKLMK